MRKNLLATLLCLTLTASTMFSTPVLAVDNVVENGTRVTLSKNNLLSDGGFENETAGTDKSISWMMPIAGKFEVIEDSSLAIEGKKLIKAKSAQDVRIAIPKVKAGYKIQISFYYKNVDSNGLWSKIKDIDNKETFTELTGANAFENATFGTGWHHVTERITVGVAGVATLVPGEYHYAMGCFGDNGSIYFDAFELIVEDENGKVVASSSDEPDSTIPLGGTRVRKLKIRKKATVKFSWYGFKGSKKVTCKTSNKKVLKIVKKTKKAVTVKGLKKGKANVIIKHGKKKAVVKFSVVKK